MTVIHTKPEVVIIASKPHAVLLPGFLLEIDVVVHSSLKHLKIRWYKNDNMARITSRVLRANKV